MVQTGKEGALLKDDIVVLSGGGCVLGGNDSAGRNVMVLDRARLIDKSEEAQGSKMRVVFYMLQVLAEEERNQTDGVVWVVNLVSPRMAETHANASKHFISLIKVMPVKSKAVHFAVVPPKTGKKAAVAEDTASRVNQSASSSGVCPVVFHRKGSVEEVGSTLQRFGLSPEGLPKCFGGTWKYEGKYTRLLFANACFAKAGGLMVDFFIHRVHQVATKALSAREVGSPCQRKGGQVADRSRKEGTEKATERDPLAPEA